jgi:plastocyanin
MSITRLLPAALVLSLSSCGGDSTGPSSGSCGTGGTATSVNVCDSFFAPASSPVSPGASVVWTWRGGLPHNVTFEDQQGSSQTQSSGTHSRTFSSTGTVRYRCTIHSSGFDPGSNQMVGSVTVQ